MLTVARMSERFELVRPIGTGGLGVVWEAIDRATGARVALKSRLNATPEAIVSFKREFRATADVRHPNLVRLDELFLSGDDWFFSMELVAGVDFLTWVEGESEQAAPALPAAGTLDRAGGGATFSASSLDHLLDAPGDDGAPPRLAAPRAPRYDEARLRDALRQLAEGLAALHEAHLVHRDVKPSNILVTSSGRVVLLDFGLVSEQRRIAHSPRTEKQIAGTVPFMSPEQARGEAVGPASDWHAVGVILHRLLAGAWPYEGTDARALVLRRERAAPSLRARGVDGPADLVALCDALLAFDPADRPDGAAVLAALGAPAASPARAAPRAGTGPAEAPVVGRSAEVGVLLDAARDVAGGVGACVVVEGAPGLGKSAVLRGFLARITEVSPRALVLAGRCYERESVAYNGFDGVMDALALHLRATGARPSLPPGGAAALARVFPALRRVPAFATPVAVGAGRPELPVEVAEVRARAVDALLRLLDAIAAERLLVVQLEDLHWAGAETLRLWELLLARLPRILLLGTRRAEGHPGLPGPAPSRVVALGPLDGDASAELIERLLVGGERPSAEHVARLVDAARGHPLLLSEAIRALGEGLDGAVSLGDVIRARVGRLSPEHRRLLDTVVVAGEPVALDVLAVATGLGVEEARSAVTDLAAARHLRVERGDARPLVACFHDAQRDTVARVLAPDVRIGLHARLAEAHESVAGRYTRPETLLAHLEGAGRIADASVYAVEAAARAADVLAFDRAVALYRRALALGVEDAARATVAERLAEALHHAGRCVEAGDAWLALADTPGGAFAPSDAARRGFLRRAAESLLMYGEIRRAIGVLQRALRAEGIGLPRSVGVLVVVTVWHELLLRLGGLRFLPQEPSAHPPERLARLDALSTASRQLSILDPVLGFSFRVRALRLALRLGNRQALVEGLALHAVSQAARGGDARTGVEDPLRTAAALVSSDTDRAVLAGCRGTASLLSGATERAADELADAEERLDRHVRGGQRAGLAHVRLWRVKALADLGRLDALADALDRLVALADSQGDRLTGMSAVRLGALRWLAEDAPDTLAAALDARPVYAPLVAHSVAHIVDARARAEIDLYRDADADTLLAHVETVRRLSRSIFGRRFQLTRIELAALAGRLHLRAGRPAEARRAVAALARERRIPLAPVLAGLLDAALRPPRGGEAEGAYAAVERDARGLGLQLLAAAAACRRAELRGDEIPHAALVAVGVRRPASLLRVLAPVLPG